MIRKMIQKLIQWWTTDHTMRRLAEEHAQRQWMEMHPVDRGDHWRDRGKDEATIQQ